MPRSLKVGSAALVAAAERAVVTVPAADALGLDPETTLFVDLRDIRERTREGFIPGSFHCPRGMAEFWVDPASPYWKPAFEPERRYLFYCASGWRSALTVRTLGEMGFEGAESLGGGFKAWRDAGGAVERVTP